MNTQQLQDALMELIDWETQDVAAAVEWIEAAANEQLAEMRDIVEIVAAVDELLPDAIDDDAHIAQYITAGLIRRARQALSATQEEK